MLTVVGAKAVNGWVHGHIRTTKAAGVMAAHGLAVAGQVNLHWGTLEQGLASPPEALGTRALANALVALSLPRITPPLYARTPRISSCAMSLLCNF